MKIRELGTQPYLTIWDQMKQFTSTRTKDTEDEVWMLQHQAVYTQGQAGKTEHILNPGSIPIVQSDRGGQVTYHGPGQLIAYVLFDIQKRNIGIRTLVCQLEKAIITTLESLNILANTQCGAPGVYVNEKKIASIGLRVKNGCTYHGIALNVAMDLTPFSGINPCGFEQLQMTQIRDYVNNITVNQVQQYLSESFLIQFGR
jgi:lipoyl(octanoyl) transferase